MPAWRHPDFRNRPVRPVPWWQYVGVQLGAAAACAIVLWWVYPAQGAERTRQHSITLLFDGADLERVSRSYFTLSGPYADKPECEAAKRGLVVMVKGARLRCDPVNPWRLK